MSKKLVAYFSASGVTAKKAEALAAAADAELYEIKPAVPYTPADIKWTNPLARCNKEWIKKAKPALADTDANIAAFDTIYLAFPIWYYTAPLIIKSFLSAYDFSGKRIVLFATSGGSGINKAVAHIQAAVPQAEVVEGAMLNGVSSFEEYINL
ncbi:MAG: NAD(P)H-dependent oxidoreductase [Clostridia bacterium]|nr:NAD(P)H-dependent oxidoreductase [Clostridia bacterium]